MLTMRCCIAIAIVTTLATGCAQHDPVVSVKGTVTYRGEPVSAGEVTFRYPELGRATSAELASDGSFELMMPTGHYKVAILPPRFVGGMDAFGNELSAPPRPENIPEKYSRIDTSGFKVTVHSKQPNEFTFAME